MLDIVTSRIGTIEEKFEFLKHHHDLQKIENERLNKQVFLHREGISLK